VNFYRYAADDPINWHDSNGRWPEGGGVGQARAAAWANDNPQQALATLEFGGAVAAAEYAVIFAAPAALGWARVAGPAALSWLLDKAPSCSGVDPNKLNHIFSDPGHNLANLVDRLGSEEAAFNAIQSEAQNAVELGGITGRYEVVVTVAGQDVTVRGIVMDGVARVGTAFVQR
jgi:hypothetical protein